MSRTRHTRPVGAWVRALWTAALTLCTLVATAQLTVGPQTNVQELARAITGPGVRIVNPVIVCHAQGYGEFSYTGTALGGITGGVLLTTGTINNALGPNNVGNRSFEAGTPGNDLLNTVTGRRTYDACRLEFDIIPGGDTLRFNFAFGSEEYHEWVGSQYNDVFGFFISGPGITGDPGIGNERNIARVPGSNQPVTINNVNNGSNQAWFRDNVGGAHVQYDGITRGLQAVSVVQPCQTYRLKLIVADASDRKFDSGVFIERIQSNAVTMQASTASGFPNLVEGCNAGKVRFTRQHVTNEPLVVPFFLRGTAINGVDYAPIGDPDPMTAKTAVIPANQASVDVHFDPIADGIPEGVENIRVLLGSSLCPGFYLDSLELLIQDSLFAAVGTPAPLCAGGSRQLSASGGLTYSWSPAAGLSAANIANPTASPAATTTYMVTVGAGACTGTASTTVTVSDMSVTGQVVNPLCDGGGNAAVNLTVGGGIPPYTFAWTGPNGFTAATEDLVNVGTGTYTVTVRDAANCTRTRSFNVNAPAQLTLTLAPSILPFGQNISCAGGNDGSINLTISGGSAPYGIAWTGPNGFTSGNEDINGLRAGAYTVTVTDASGCTATASRTLVEPPAMTPSIGSVTHVGCFGEATGSATASVAGGIPPYSYVWNTVPAQHTATATDLPAGTWSVTITDGYGCVSQGSVRIEGPAAALAIAFSGVQDVRQCQGQNDPHGEATATASGGTAPYTYAWNTLPALNGATATFTSGGTWMVTVTDAKGCTATASVTVQQPDQPTASMASQEDILCHGDANGSATVQFTGGSSIQSITWNTVPSQSGNTATGLGAGTYTVTAQHADGCQTTASVTIQGPADPLSASITSQSGVDCFGDANGGATVSAQGGTTPYTYMWDTAPVQSGASATGLSAGSHTVTVTDAKGCTAQAVAGITGPASPLVVASTNSNDVLCFGQAEGGATAQASGGTAPYVYSWNDAPAQSDPTVAHLPAGTWTVTVTDAQGCTATTSVTISGPTADVEAWIDTYTHETCFGANDGTVTISISGGSGSYTTTWNTVPPQIGTTAINLPRGLWTATVMDNNGCGIPKLVHFDVLGPAVPLHLDLQLSQVSCHGGVDGAIDLTLSGGNAPYHHHWTDDHGNLTGLEDLSGLDAGNYHLRVTDAFGCIADTTVILTQPDAIVLAGGITTASCQGSATGAVDAIVSGGTAPYSAGWVGPNGFTSASLGITGLDAGVYTLIITDTKGCTATRSYDVGEPGQVEVDGVAATHAGGWNISCPAAMDGSMDVTVNGGTSPYQYTWSGPGGYASTDEDLSGLSAGTYTLTVTDANGCARLAGWTLTAPQAIAATLKPGVHGGQHISCTGAADGSINTTITGGTAPYHVAWTGPSGFNSTVEDIAGLGPGAYTVTITDANGCTKEVSVTLLEPAPLGATYTTSTSSSGDAIACHGGSTGGIVLNLSGGTAPRTVSWTGPHGFIASTADISGLGAGTYTAVVTDANGCTASVDATLTEPAPIAVDAVAADHNGQGVSCSGATDGAIVLTVGGGAGSAMFSWSGPNGYTSSDQDISGLAAGAYTVVVTDANGCTAVRNVTLTEPSALGANPIPAAANCSGASDGGIGLDIHGGTAPYGIQWNGPNGFASTDADLSGLEAGDYTVTITDANGCVFNGGATVAVPGTLVLGIDVSGFAGNNVSCAGAVDGRVDLTITGGTAPFTIAWSDGTGFSSGDAHLTGLGAGVYDVIVTDANGCTAMERVTLTAPQPLDLTASIPAFNGHQVSCHGGSDGSIDLLVNGGTAPFTFLWNHGATTEDLSGIGAGNYSVVVTDANGCTATVGHTLSAPDAISVVPLAGTRPGGFSTSCATSADGEITTTIGGGIAPYTIAWAGPNGFMSGDADLTGIGAGMYTITVTDANGCVRTAEVVLTAPGPVAVQLNSTTYNGGYHIRCAGGTTGNITASAGGGIPGHTYSWSGPNGHTSTDAQLNGLSAGLYTVTVTDANGCTATNSITLTEPAPLDINAVLSDAGSGHQIGCAGNDGTIGVTVTGGTPQYNFSWSGPGGFGSTAPNLSNLVAGTYTLTLSDANGCTAVRDFTLNAPAPLDAVFSTTPNTCPGDASGGIITTITGGAWPYVLDWNGPGGFTSSDADLNGIGAGNYTLGITDAMGCTAVFNTTLTGPAPIQGGTYVSFYGQYNLKCNGDSSGVIELDPRGGSAPFTFAWTGPNGFTSGDARLSGLRAGGYQVRITDANGCMMDTLVTLTDPPMPLLTTLDLSLFPSGTNVSCHGSTDGWINATVVGGTGPYTFSWRGPDSLIVNTSLITGLGAGNYVYELVVTDVNQCSFFTHVTLTQPDSAIHADITTGQFNGGFQVSCNGASDGAIDLSASGGNGGFTYQWNGPGGFASNGTNLSGLGAGSYTVTITDINGCTLTDTVTLAAPDLLTATLGTHRFPSGDAISCHGANDGSITASIAGGTPGHALSWTGPNGFVSTDSVLTNLVPGDYCLNVTDANGCTFQTCVTIAQPALLSANGSAQPAACGQSVGTVGLTVTGGSAPYAYLWSNGATTRDLSGLDPGTYTVRVTDVNGCTATVQATVGGTPGVDAQGTVTDNLCFDGRNGRIDLSMSAGTAPFSYQWSHGATTRNALDLPAGNHVVTVTDANGCTWSGSWTIAQPQALVVDTVLSRYNGYNVSSWAGSDGSIRTSVSGGTPPYTYHWSDGAGTHSRYGLPAGTYGLEVRDANGCSVFLTITLTRPDDLRMPTGFTPNGDGANDFFVVQGLDAYPNNQLVIVNRWGNTVYERLNYRNDWNGDNTRGEPLPDGTYFAILRVNDGERTLQGYVDLRR